MSQTEIVAAVTTIGVCIGMFMAGVVVAMCTLSAFYFAVVKERERIDKFDWIATASMVIALGIVVWNAFIAPGLK